MNFRNTKITIVILGVLTITGCSLWNLLFSTVDHNKISHVIDRYGRIVVYHGANHSNYSKHSPDNLPWHDGSEYDHLVRWGFNVMRFQVYWSAVEPSPGNINFDYLNGVDKHIRALEDRGIDVVIDWHQDVYSKKFSGNGLPDWTVHDDGFPFEEREPWHMNYKEPAVIAAFTHFWKNTDQIQTKCLQAIILVLKRFENRTNIVGIDPFNEPFPGAYIVTFEAQELTNYYIDLEKRLADAGLDIPIWFEPSIFSSTIIPTRLSFNPNKLAIYFPHYYDATIDYGVNTEYGKVGWRVMKESIEIKVLEAMERKVPLVIGEFGMKAGVERRLNFYEDMMYLADRYAFGWTVYSFDQTIHTSMALIDTAGNDMPMMKILCRPYPQRIAGTAPRWSVSKGKFKVSYKPKVDLREPTVVFIPPIYSNIQLKINDGEWKPFSGGKYEHHNDGGDIQKIVATWE